MGRLLVIANRLPFSISKKAGEFSFRPSPGGLATGLSSLPDSLERFWIGWPTLLPVAAEWDTRHRQFVLRPD